MLLPLLIVASAASAPMEVSVENGVRVHRPAVIAEAPGKPEQQTRVVIDPGYRGTELYRPSRYEQRALYGTYGLYLLAVEADGRDYPRRMRRNWR